MYKKSFFFIVFEGVEGTGKSYQIKKLYKNLKKLKINSIKTREPGGSATAESIRSLIFQNKSLIFDSITDFYLMLASRNEHIKKTLNKAKKEKKIIICDRFIDSTFAYQVVGSKIDRKINKINQDYILNGLKPHLTIVLKSDMQTIFSRIKKRKKINKFDNLKKSFYVKAQNTFINLAKKNKNYHLFDSSKNNNVLEKKIYNLVKKLIKA